MSEREELEAEIAAIEQAWLFSEDAGDTAGRRRHLATALLSSGYTKGNGELVEAVRVWGEAQPRTAAEWQHKEDSLFEAWSHFKALSDSEDAVRSGRSDGDDAGRALIPVEVLKKAIEIQTEGREMHPLTCPNRGDAHHAAVFDNGVNIDVGTLLPTSAYLICVACGYQQDYSHPAAQFLLEAARSAAQDTQRAERATNGELHGDGVRDDTEAVQERVNAGLTIGGDHE